MWRSLAVAAWLLAAGCNALIGVDDVTLANDGGSDVVDGAVVDAPIDAPIDAMGAARVGEDEEFGGQTDVLANFDLAREVQVLVGGDLVGFGVITKAAGGAAGQLRMGLYEDNAGEPGNFIARSGVIADFPVGETTAQVSPVALGPGTYWIAIAFNADTAVGADGSMLVDSCFAMRADFANSIPNTGFGTPTCNSAEKLNLFILLEN